MVEANDEILGDGGHVAQNDRVDGASAKPGERRLGLEYEREVRVLPCIGD